jgi:hypothetical protein
LNQAYIIEAMKACEQTSGLNVLQHGESVRDFYLDLKQHILEGKPLKHPWRIPAWAGQKELWALTLDDQALAEYQIFHDCSKPFCRTVDEEGRAHFPNHAALSEQIWLQAGGNPLSARLMGMDMDIHLLSGEGIQQFCSQPEAASLLLTGLSEIHSNAQMFGGIESTSFKMKWKHIDRRGKQIAKILTGQ